MSESLFQISTELARLMNQRDDLIVALAAAPDANEQVSIGRAIEALEVQIREEAQPNSMQKVDNCRAWDLHCSMHEKAAEAEEKKQAANRKMWKDRRDLMRRFAKMTMEELGVDRLEGKLGCIRLQANGGSAPGPLISQPDLVPPRLCMYTATINYVTFLAFLRVLENSPNWTREQHERLCDAFHCEPNAALVNEALNLPCPECDGTGKDYDTSECDEHTGSNEIACAECVGTGKISVPGCSLQERQKHVRIQ